MEQGTNISIEYSLFTADGTKVGSNVGEEPLTYQHGGQQIPPVLEERLGALAEGESADVTLTPEEGYGPVDPDAFQDVPLDAVPEDARSKGAELFYDDEEGERHLMRVHEVEDEKIILDFNHPLAGETLTFKVKILSIQPGAVDA